MITIRHNRQLRAPMDIPKDEGTPKRKPHLQNQHNSRWTPELERKLRALVELGLSGGEIAARMPIDVSRCSVLAKARRMGLKVGGPPPCR